MRGEGREEVVRLQRVGYGGLPCVPMLSCSGFLLCQTPQTPLIPGAVLEGHRVCHPVVPEEVGREREREGHGRGFA